MFNEVSVPENEERQQQILDAAATVIMRVGYDKTGMTDIATEAGASRGTVYLYFKSKEEIFEALVFREWMAYSETWITLIEADPRGGTIGSFYRAIFKAINTRPLMASIMRRDRHVIGNYIRKSDNIFASLLSRWTTVDFVRMLQTAGTVRQDIDPVVAAHLIDMLSYGWLTIEDFKPSADFPPEEAVLEGIADLLDARLTPPDGGNIEAGKAVILQITVAGREQLAQAKRTKSKSIG